MLVERKNGWDQSFSLVLTRVDWRVSSRPSSKVRVYRPAGRPACAAVDPFDARRRSFSGIAGSHVVDAAVSTAAESMRTLTVDRQVIERKVLAKAARWKSLLAGGIVERRQFLRGVLDGPICFKPEGNAYRFRGADRRGREISALGGRYHLLWRPHRATDRVDSMLLLPFSGEVLILRRAV